MLFALLFSMAMGSPRALPFRMDDLESERDLAQSSSSGDLNRGGRIALTELNELNREEPAKIPRGRLDTVLQRGTGSGPRKLEGERRLDRMPFVLRGQSQMEPSTWEALCLFCVQFRPLRVFRFTL
jgi:hypothetical protein